MLAALNHNISLIRNMLRISTENPSDGFIEFIQSWFDLLAANHLEEACMALDKPNIYGIKWSPDMIKSILEENFGPETIFGKEHPEGVSVTAIAETKGEVSPDVIKFTDGSGYSVEHDVPLNGEWSDLTAQFEFLRFRHGYAVVLHDLHVM
ncbi:MAG: hypothetical protein ABW086_05385 [Sedimenticola sp.]